MKINYFFRRKCKNEIVAGMEFLIFDQFSDFQTPSVARDMTVHDNTLAPITKESMHRGRDPSTSVPLESWSPRLQLNLKVKGGHENVSTVYAGDFLKIILWLLTI